MNAPEGYEHLDALFWDRVEPDPDSSCLIYQTKSLSPSYKGKTLLSYLVGSGAAAQRHRSCYRAKCVNPDHIAEGKYTPRAVYAPRVKTSSQFDRQYSQC
jgi:hypothetical protein